MFIAARIRSVPLACHTKPALEGAVPLISLVFITPSDCSNLAAGLPVEIAIIRFALGD